MNKLIIVILLLVVVSTIHSVFGKSFYEPRTMLERKDFKGNLGEYLVYCYWTPVVKERCEYGIDGSCNRHDSRSECTSIWDDCTSTEKKAIVGTFFFNLALLFLVWKVRLKGVFKKL